MTFDATYAEPGEFESWKTKLSHPDSDIRDMVVRTFDNFLDGNELWISNKDEGKLDKKYVAYLMSVIVDVMIEEEICLNFRIENDCLVTIIDEKADVIDCKEFFEEFYHLATGFNFDGYANAPAQWARIYTSYTQRTF